MPETIREEISTPLGEIGRGTYRKFGFRIYDASLWAAQKPWEASKPYALQLIYARDLSKDTLVDTVYDDISENASADEATLARWKVALNNSLCAVEEGDSLVGLALPGEKTLLFHNGTQIASIDDQGLSKAFFGIWLGDYADEDLRKELLGNI